LCEVQRKGDEEAEEKARKELDDAVFDALGLTEDERKQVYEGLEYLRKMRRERKQVGMLVEAKEAWKPLKRTKRKEIEKYDAPSKRLDLWV